MSLPAHRAKPTTPAGPGFDVENAIPFAESGDLVAEGEASDGETGWSTVVAHWAPDGSIVVDRIEPGAPPPPSAVAPHRAESSYVEDPRSYPYPTIGGSLRAFATGAALNAMSRAEGEPIPLEWVPADRIPPEWRAWVQRRVNRAARALGMGPVQVRWFGPGRAGRTPDLWSPAPGPGMIPTGCVPDDIPNTIALHAGIRGERVATVCAHEVHHLWERKTARVQPVDRYASEEAADAFAVAYIGGDGEAHPSPVAALPGGAGAAESPPAEGPGPGHWWRVTRKTFAWALPTDQLYQLTLEIVPQSTVTGLHQVVLASNYQGGAPWNPPNYQTLQNDVWTQFWFQGSGWSAWTPPAVVSDTDGYAGPVDGNGHVWQCTIPPGLGGTYAVHWEFNNLYPGFPDYWLANAYVPANQDTHIGDGLVQDPSGYTTLAVHVNGVSAFSVTRTIDGVPPQQGHGSITVNDGDVVTLWGYAHGFYTSYWATTTIGAGAYGEPPGLFVLTRTGP